MKKYQIFLSVMTAFLFFFILCQSCFAVVTLPANLQIRRPAPNQVLRPGQRFTVAVSIDQRAAGSVDRLTVRLKTGTGSLDEREIRRGITTNNEIELTVPEVFVEGTATIEATIAGTCYFTGDRATRDVRLEFYNANVNITMPANNSSFDVNDRIAATVTINPEAAGPAVLLRVKISQGDTILAEREVHNPQASNQVTFDPINPMYMGFTLTLRAELEPSNRFRGRPTDTRLIQYTKANPMVNILAPTEGASINPLTPAAATVAINPDTVGAVTSLTVSVKSGGNTVVSTTVQNPQAVNEVQIGIIPVHNLGENLTIMAEAAPAPRFQGRLRDEKHISIAQVNPQIQITSPQNGAEFHPGATMPVTVTLNPQAAAAVNNLYVYLKRSDGSIIAQAAVNNPRASNQVSLQIPPNATRDTIIEASAAPANIFSPNRQSINITVTRPAANIQITNPQEGAGFKPGENIPVTVTMQAEAVGMVNKITVRVLQNNAPIAEAEINNPQTINQVQLRVPASARAGEPALIAASAYPENTVTNGTVQKNINIEKINANLKIRDSGKFEQIMPGGGLRVTITMNQDAVGAAKEIIVSAKTDKGELEKIRIKNPQASNPVTFNIPPNILADTVYIHAVLMPADNFINNEDTAKISAGNPKL